MSKLVKLHIIQRWEGDQMSATVRAKSRDHYSAAALLSEREAKFVCSASIE